MIEGGSGKHSRILFCYEWTMKNAMEGFDSIRGGNLKIHLLPLAMAMLMLPSFQCSSTKSLSDAERAKLDPPLIRLLAGEQVDKQLVRETLRPDGVKEYAVIVRSEHPEEIKVLGATVSSVIGDVMVVHATIDELYNIVSLPSVHAVTVGSKIKIQQHQ
jgi:hypothetical protein